MPRYHQVNFAVIPSNGDEIFKYQKTLERVLGSLREPTTDPAGFALIDADKGKPVPNQESPQQHVRFLQLSCYESENLYLSDEVLALMGTTWTDAQVKIAAEAGKYGQKGSGRP